MDLEGLEAELTREVPALLDTMNQASNDINMLEGEISKAEAKVSSLLHGCSFDKLRARHGDVVDRTRPYFEAMTKLHAATKLARVKADLYYNAVNHLETSRAKLRLMEEKSASPFQDDVSLLQERVRLYKQKCDRREEEHTRALDDLRQAESKVHDVKSQASMMEVWRAAPLFQVLHRQQAKLKKAHHNLKFLTDKASESKSLYSSAISDLERISTAVHTIRQG
eukprot:CAMPEP_0194503114 /NCGR_PEP_ID=MMETSP0253-20130528/28199_1 /TAXON_ID=2966 /ORGANISM="Noctiluca scintillans" /LENGTH=223 /DNA_ID=CAMNT_0039345365 /DNA_START=45 /DNA_END=719 /DNA_ORIENTATION=+